MKFEKGQSVVVSHKSHYHAEPIIREGTVVSIGRKYVTVEFGSHARQFHIESGDEKTEYSPNYWVWASMQAFEESEEASALRLELSKAVSANLQRRTLTLEQMRRIKAIIDEA